MNKYIVEKRMNELKSLCKKRGLRVTKQKEGIYRILLNDTTHPTADDIYKKLKEQNPKVSFATVYDNLRKLKALQLIQEVSCGEGCNRFEANMNEHHHLINLEKRTITDIYLNKDQQIPMPKELNGKKIREIKITYII